MVQGKGLFQRALLCCPRPIEEVLEDSPDYIPSSIACPAPAPIDHLADDRSIWGSG